MTEQHEDTGRERPARRTAARRGEPAGEREGSHDGEHNGSARSDAARNGTARNGTAPPRKRGRARGALPAHAARRAAEEIVALTGRELESVVSIERRDEGWMIGVEVVETRRIPDSADILAVFEVEVDEHGDLLGYKRTGRHSRGQLHRGGR
ncbi:hypothetical protein GCM10023215_33340 [Pseudonocardia yuanmonensis]|uniref:Gas vesicle protein GvpO n=1 Tax=Pseudonocardia yuanmonensis TaxID=1095914 RepID=A0ABP8WPR1_9PSEU